MNIQIDKEFKNLIPPLMDEEYEGLKENLKRNGCEEPLTLWNNFIIDGHNRYEICTKNKIKFKVIKKKFKNKDDVKVWIINKQLDRRNISKYDRTRLALRKEEILKPIAKENQKGGKGGKLLPPILAKADTRETISKLAKVSHGTVDKVKYIEQKAPKEIKKQLSKGEETISGAYNTLKRAEKEEKREQERKEDKKKAEKVKSPEELFKEVKFTTVVIDPPWDLNDEGDTNQMGRAKPNYSTMSIEELKKLPIPNIIKKDAHIYLWITNRSLYKGFELLKAWGFRYIVCLTWCKPSFGMGNYFRGSTEHLLFGIKGSLPLKNKNTGTWFLAKRGEGGHSSKPDELYELVEKCSPGLYLDYFGRKERKGWYSYGVK